MSVEKSFGWKLEKFRIELRHHGMGSIVACPDIGNNAANLREREGT